MSNAHGIPIDFRDTAVITPGERIRAFADIPDLLTMETPPVEWIVDRTIARKTITLWTGTDGSAKTFLAQKMSIAVATGGGFLGRRCQRAPVLYLDYENPVFSVKDRLELMWGEGPIPNLRVWGSWLEQQPPQIGHELLLSIAKEVRPLIIVDPFRYAHGAEENDSTEMMAVMQQLRYCAAQGAAVIVLHHPSKQEGSTGRGSSAIRGAADVAFLQELSEETDLITLRCVKNRFGERWIETIKPDFEAGTFEVTDSPAWSRRNVDVEKLCRIIEDSPGLSQNAIYKHSGMKKGRMVALLKQEEGTFWRSEKDGASMRYFSLVPKQGTTQGTREQVTQEGVVPLFPPSKEGTREQPLPDPSNCSLSQGTTLAKSNGKTLPSCSKCGSHAIYRDGSCQTCGLENAVASHGGNDGKR